MPRRFWSYGLVAPGFFIEQKTYRAGCVHFVLEFCIRDIPCLPGKKVVCHRTGCRRNTMERADKRGVAWNYRWKK